MNTRTDGDITDVIGNFPYRMALAGGWIDQPFVSKHNPDPPGSMVTVNLNPMSWYMERAGIATGTRGVALDLWGGTLPDQDRSKLVRELYAKENSGQANPSGSQDMIGLVYPGINRLDFDYAFEHGVFPRHIESNNDPNIARWLEEVIHVLPIAQRPAGYSPLGVKNLDPEWIRRLGQSGKDCYDAVINRKVEALGRSMNESIRCWEAILPQTLRHPLLMAELPDILAHYQGRYQGAMYSGCGGGYLYVVSEEPVSGSFKVSIRLSED